jgi:hypothetical protein
MKRKVKRFSLINGVSTINLGGSVRSSVDSGSEYFKQYNMKMFRTELGITVLYDGPNGQALEQEVPNGTFHNVLYDVEEKWEDPKAVKKS